VLRYFISAWILAYRASSFAQEVVDRQLERWLAQPMKGSAPDFRPIDWLTEQLSPIMNRTALQGLLKVANVSAIKSYELLAPTSSSSASGQKASSHEASREALDALVVAGVALTVAGGAWVVVDGHDCDEVAATT
jgi:hypothetical protein